MHIRPARSDDYAAFTALFAELKIDDPIPTAQHWRDRLAAESLIAEHAGDVVGYVSFYKLARAGHVRNLVVGPTARQTGVGGELMRAAADDLRRGGISEWHLNVKDDNAAAIRLYERLGMTVEYRTTVLAMPWDVARTIPSSHATVLPVEPESDDDIERALDLVAGRIAMLRKRGDLLFHARDASLAPVGLSAFTPSFPGAYPFRALTVGDAAALLHAMEPHRLAHRDAGRVQLVIENHDELAQHLIAAGAIDKLRLRHYLGAL